jgi:DNA uptake protein ComE-like DNA-binding protein
MRKVILAAALMVLGGTAVASAQTTPATPPKADSAMKHGGAMGDSAMKQGAMTSDTAMKQAGQVASVNLNTATQAQLEAIPALKPYADKIIKGRPYKSVDQLADSNILPKDVFGATKSQLTVSKY